MLIANIISFRLCGGVGQNNLLLKLICALTNCKIERMRESEMSLAGTMYLAGLGAGKTFFGKRLSFLVTINISSVSRVCWLYMTTLLVMVHLRSSKTQNYFYCFIVEFLVCFFFLGFNWYGKSPKSVPFLLKLWKNWKMLRKPPALCGAARFQNLYFLGKQFH